jgi:DNA-binding PadR family transcriptional regulator
MERVLVALKALGTEATATQIVALIHRYHLPEPTLSSVYLTLDRLFDQGLVVRQQGAPTPVQGGKANVYYTLSPKGVAAVKEADRQRAALQDLSDQRPPKLRSSPKTKGPNVS